MSFLAQMDEGFKRKTRGSLSWLDAPCDAKIGACDTTPSPLVPQKALFKGLEGPKDWFLAENFRLWTVLYYKWCN